MASSVPSPATARFGFFGDDGPATKAQVNGGPDPVALAVDKAGNVYLPDAGNARIRKVDPTGIITTFAGNGSPGYAGDGGSAIEAAIGRSHGIAVDDAGDVYFSADNETVRKVDTSGVISTVAGTGKPGFAGDCGTAVDAQLSVPERRSRPRRRPVHRRCREQPHPDGRAVGLACVHTCFVKHGPDRARQRHGHRPRPGPHGRRRPDARPLPGTGQHRDRHL